MGVDFWSDWIEHQKAQTTIHKSTIDIPTSDDVLKRNDSEYPSFGVDHWVVSRRTCSTFGSMIDWVGSWLGEIWLIPREKTVIGQFQCEEH